MLVFIGDGLKSYIRWNTLVLVPLKRLLLIVLSINTNAITLLRLHMTCNLLAIWAAKWEICRSQWKVQYVLNLCISCTSEILSLYPTTEPCVCFISTYIFNNLFPHEQCIYLYFLTILSLLNCRRWSRSTANILDQNQTMYGQYT